MDNTKNTLHLFSGGRDSFLAAGILAEKKYTVQLVTYNNGHTEGIERVKTSADILCERYKGNIKFVGIHNTAMTMQSFLKNIWTEPLQRIVLNYPNINISQTNCLMCKLAMYVHSIAYCKAKNIHYISDGTRRCQGFFVDNEETQSIIKELLDENGIELLMPLYELQSDYQRKMMLNNRRLPTKTYEPQCFIGLPLNEELEEKHIMELKLLFQIEIKPNIQTYIDELIEVKKNEQ